ncbi:hypothetical protein RJ639_032391 [Escallonia herrerae]|uniref:Reverse transcriptase Ty1/copia-type domain-containing protein n=1 Tax=Escallonia herrerae TaxID=1293975 RepID=A0AA89BAQ4_9ASTE|nr:hypothetical protein RJ639_032391 [Escallonia herrerae]
MEDARYKAYLLAKDFTQIEGIDYNEIFYHVVKHTSIRLLLAMVALYDFKLEELDVKAAFLRGELEEQIFVRHPEGFVIQNKKDHVFLLKKSLYGLTHSPRQWYKRFDTHVERGCTKNAFDSCVYHQRLADCSHIYLLFYVDDILIATKTMSNINEAEYIAATKTVKEAIWLKGLVGFVMVEKICVVENPADMMTKHIPEIKLKHCFDLIRINSI